MILGNGIDLYLMIRNQPNNKLVFSSEMQITNIMAVAMLVMMVISMNTTGAMTIYTPITM